PEALFPKKVRSSRRFSPSRRPSLPPAKPSIRLRAMFSSLGSVNQKGQIAGDRVFRVFAHLCAEFREASCKDALHLPDIGQESGQMVVIRLEWNRVGVFDVVVLGGLSAGRDPVPSDPVSAHLL